MRALAETCDQLARQWHHIAQARRVNRRRGAWRRPQLVGTVRRLEQALLREFERTERAVAATLVGTPVPRQALTEPEPTVAAALARYDLDAAVADQPVARDRLAAVLLLLALWRDRQLRMLEEFGAEVFTVGRTQALKRAGRPEATASPAASDLLSQLTEQFQRDAQRLYGDLLDGSPRTGGVRTLVETGATLGVALLGLLRLFDSESFRLGMWAEALVWRGWLAGFRAGVVDASAALMAAGLPPLAVRWVGPDDPVTCDPCRARFGLPVEVRSLADVPDPTTICAYGLACRHHWVIE